jgi:hypothetical protein
MAAPNDHGTTAGVGAQRGGSEIRFFLMASWERISESQATLEKVDSSVLVEFEAHSVRDPNNVANFKFGTLVSQKLHAALLAVARKRGVRLWRTEAE